MADTWEETLFEIMMSLILIAVIFAAGCALLFTVSFAVAVLTVWASITAILAVICLVMAAGCYLGIVAIQKWESRKYRLMRLQKANNAL